MGYNEIVTKAVISKGKKSFKDSYTVTTEIKPSNVLGIWVINHKFKGYKTKDKIGVDGSYDVNIWYSYDDDSKTTVVNKKIEYNNLFNMKDESEDSEVVVRSLTQPNCVKVDIDENGDIKFDIEKELGVEIVGEKKIKISSLEGEEPWNVLDDDIDSEIDENVNKDYIK